MKEEVTVLNSIRDHRRWLLPAIAATAIVTVVVVAAVRKDPAEVVPKEILLVAKDSAFHLADHPDEPNPALQLAKGTPVKLIIRNDEPEKVLHCFTIAGLDVNTSRNLATGDSELLLFTPEETGTFAYACLMHPSMSGKVVVR